MQKQEKKEKPSVKCIIRVNVYSLSTITTVIYFFKNSKGQGYLKHERAQR